MLSLRSISLKRRLLVVLIGLLVIGFFAIDLVTYTSLRSFLNGRLDEQISLASNQEYHLLMQAYLRGIISSASEVSHEPFLEDALAHHISPDEYIELVGDNHQVIFKRPSGSPGANDPPFELPSVIPVTAFPDHPLSSSHRPYHPSKASFDITARGKDHFIYRAQAVAVPGGTLIIAIPLAPVASTLSSLFHIELVVSLTAMAGVFFLGLLAIRAALRPLVDMTNTASTIAAGDLSKRVAIATPETEVGRLGLSLNTMLERIEKAFAERTASQEKLKQFVADASHELRTPLTSIGGYAELFRRLEPVDREGARRAVKKIEEQSRRMGVLIDELLLLARLDQGRSLNLATVDLVKIVEEAVEDARVSHPTHPIVMQLPVSNLVVADAQRMRQVVDNLLSNALTHTPEETLIEVTIHVVGNHSELEVRDHGPGLSAEESDKVFYRFYQGNSARTGEGSGLGLAIVAAIAEAQGGKARVRSEPGKGTSFVVEIPIAE
ncbi:MAG: HAMP domain-containing histidine kinase [Actinobacteria bacterium]|nr:HAMP domain-containing histidine kinase [Actinomycetota bacterium]MCL6094214.1 HAMP domain-containing histidine kinase [Actinomycetota bacterium]